MRGLGLEQRGLAGGPADGPPAPDLSLLRESGMAHGAAGRQPRGTVGFLPAGQWGQFRELHPHGAPYSQGLYCVFLDDRDSAESISIGQHSQDASLEETLNPIAEAMCTSQGGVSSGGAGSFEEPGLLKGKDEAGIYRYVGRQHICQLSLSLRFKLGAGGRWPPGPVPCTWTRIRAQLAVEGVCSQVLTGVASTGFPDLGLASRRPFRDQR